MKIITSLSLITVIGLGLSSCAVGKKDQTPTFVPEESGLNLIKLTDESKGNVVGPEVGGWGMGNFQTSTASGNKKGGMKWSTGQLLRVSPKGDEYAHLSRYNDNDNILVRKTRTDAAPTQRTFKNVYDFFWGPDDNLYFAEIEPTALKINSVNAHSGSIVRQITSNNWDWNPAVTQDGSIVFFTRNISGTEPMIWSYNMKSGEVTNCTRGYNPAVVGDSKDEIICVRNNNRGQSEIWKVNYKDGQETLLLTDESRSFSNPHVSPDGEWIVVQGNAISSLNKRKNLDLFALRIDGSDFMQLTFHPANDTNPQWSSDGQEILFISDRATKKGNNVWKMRFKPY